MRNNGDSKLSVLLDKVAVLEDNGLNDVMLVMCLDLKILIMLIFMIVMY